MISLILTPKVTSVFNIWILGALDRPINRRNDPMLVGFSACHRVFVCLSNKTNFTKSKFMESEL